jgi:hypothetical protein
MTMNRAQAAAAARSQRKVVMGRAAETVNILGPGWA